MPPAIRGALDQLGLWNEFQRDGHRPSSRSLAAWGSPNLASNDRIFQIDRIAWRLGRLRFDAMLQRAAAAVGPTLDAFVRAAEAGRDGLRLHLDDGRTLAARYAIDATGRAAALGRALGAEMVSIDRLVAAATRVARQPAFLRDLTIESDPLGWWYGNDLADGTCLVVRLSDADLIRRADLGDALRQTRHLASCAPQRDVPSEAPQLHAATSRRIVLRPDLPLIAAGDAAWTQDPVSGEGILKALRSGIFAAYAVSDWLAARDPTGLARYRTFVDGAWRAYRTHLGQQYRTETRWPDAPFWQRRADL